MAKTTREKMLNALTTKKGRAAFSVAQAQTRFGIVGVRQRISDLRNDGYNIVSLSRKGKRSVAYSLSRGR
jgi:hypothetical protein